MTNGTPAATEPTGGSGIGRRDPTSPWRGFARPLDGLILRKRRWSQANTFLAITLVVAAGLVVGATALAGEVYEAVMDANGIERIDHPLLAWVMTIRTPLLNHVIAFYSNTGGPVLQPIITGAVVVFLCWRWRSVTPLILTLIAMAGSLLMTWLGRIWSAAAARR